MILPLITYLAYASASADIQPCFSELKPPSEDIWMGNARFVKKRTLMNTSEKLFMTKDPDFALAHQFSTIGLTTIVVGSASTVGSLLVAGLFGTFGAIDPNGDGTGNRIADSSLTFAKYSN